jgi:hypothetical protein
MPNTGRLRRNQAMVERLLKNNLVNPAHIKNKSGTMTSLS